MQNEEPGVEKRKPLLDLRDATFLCGVALVTTGTGMIYLPAGFILLGAVLLTLSVIGVPRWRS